MISAGLDVPELLVGAGFFEEFFVGAGRGDGAVFNDDNAIHFHDCGESMGDDEYGFVLHEFMECIVN